MEGSSFLIIVLYTIYFFFVFSILLPIAIGMCTRQFYRAKGEMEQKNRTEEINSFRVLLNTLVETQKDIMKGAAKNGEKEKLDA